MTHHRFPAKNRVRIRFDLISDTKRALTGWMPFDEITERSMAANKRVRTTESININVNRTKPGSRRPEMSPDIKLNCHSTSNVLRTYVCTYVLNQPVKISNMIFSIIYLSNGWWVCIVWKDLCGFFFSQFVVDNGRWRCLGFRLGQCLVLSNGSKGLFVKRHKEKIWWNLTKFTRKMEKGCISFQFK